VRSSHDTESPIPLYRLIDIYRFLLASLNIEAILQEPTMYRRRERLSKMTDGLGLEDVYGATIERIKAQSGGKSRLGIEALMWVNHAERPLEAGELCRALAVELGSRCRALSLLPSCGWCVAQAVFHSCRPRRDLLLNRINIINLS